MAPEAYEGQERAAEGRRGHMGTLEATRGIRRLLKGVEAGEGKEWRVMVATVRLEGGEPPETFLSRALRAGSPAG